jgi:hypothetical protein
MILPIILHYFLSSQAPDSDESSLENFESNIDDFKPTCDDILDPQLDQGYSGEFRVLSLLTFR